MSGRGRGATRERQEDKEAGKRDAHTHGPFGLCSTAWYYTRSGRPTQDSVVQTLLIEQVALSAHLTRQSAHVAFLHKC